MNTTALMPWGIAALFVFIMYRRVRRHIGAQKVTPKRMIFRLVILGLVTCALLVPTVLMPQLLEADGAGLAAGLILAFVGLRLTRFEWRDDELFYVPNLYVSLVVIGLIIGRIVYKMTFLYTASHGFSDQAALQSAQQNQSILHSPITLAVLFAMIGYYLVYYGGILWKSRHHHREAAA